MSSNARAVYYTTSAALYGQAQCAVAEEEEEEIILADSDSARMFPTHGIMNFLEVLALICNGAITKEDVVMDHNKP